VLFDKFGEEGLKKYYEGLYRHIYRYRLIKKQVKYNAMTKEPNLALKIFPLIRNANSLEDLSELNKPAWTSDEADAPQIQIPNKIVNFIKNERHA